MALDLAKAQSTDIPAILRLQEENLLTNIPADRRAAGFVTTAFTVPQLESLIARGHAFVARPESGARDLAGYVLAGDWPFYFQWPIFEYMASRFPALKFEGAQVDAKISYQYGPVCVANAARGTGVLPALFDFHRAGMAGEFPMGVTFINEANERSMDAHVRKLGLAKIDAFQFGGHSFATLAFWTGES